MPQCPNASHLHDRSRHRPAVMADAFLSAFNPSSCSAPRHQLLQPRLLVSVSRDEKAGGQHHVHVVDKCWRLTHVTLPAFFARDVILAVRSETSRDGMRPRHRLASAVTWRESTEPSGSLYMCARTRRGRGLPTHGDAALCRGSDTLESGATPGRARRSLLRGAGG
eukprot:UN25420